MVPDHNGPASSRQAYPPHMPRRGAPHGQAPDSAAALALVEPEPPETAKTDSSCSTLRLRQLSHVTRSVLDRTIFSNWAPQSWQRYSKIGMRITLQPALNGEI